MESNRDDSDWHPASCWVITQKRESDYGGRDGREIHGEAVALAMGVVPSLKRVCALSTFSLPNLSGKPPGNAALSPPWPELVIAIGRQGLRWARWVRKQSGGETFLAVLQKPALPFHGADFIWAPSHDRLRGKNVVSSLFSPHPFTKQKLQAAAERFTERFEQLPRPRIGVLVGGTSRAYRFAIEDIEQLCSSLQQLIEQDNAGLIITTSNRTLPEHCHLLERRFAGLPALLWDRSDRDFYPALLGTADIFVATPDSTNMISEAASTGKPILLFPMKTRSPRFRWFHKEIERRGITRPLGERLEFWDYTPINATEEIAAALLNAMRARQGRV